MIFVTPHPAEKLQYFFGVFLQFQIGVDRVCILAAAPIALAGFFNYNGMTLEQFAWAFIKSEILCAGERRFISRNFHYELLKRKGGQDFD